MRSRCVQTVAGALLALWTLAPAHAGPAAAPNAVVAQDADPALWVLQDEDTTIYLFGTIHVLPPGLTWFDEAVAEAFDAADELRTEVVMPDDPMQLVPVMLRHATDTSGKPLSSRLTPRQRDLWRAGVGSIGLTAEQLEGYKPWFVGLQLSVGMLAALGMDPSHGVEEVLRVAAKRTGKRMTSFETVEEQMTLIDSTPESEQILGMMEIVEDAAQSRRDLEDLVDGWARGEPERTGALLNESMADAPETARILLTDRNRRWAESLRARMDEPGTVFVAVGAGHLAGKDSVQDFLALLGLQAVRVRY